MEIIHFLLKIEGNQGKFERYIKIEVPLDKGRFERHSKRILEGFATQVFSQADENYKNIMGSIAAGICNICLTSHPANQDGYAYETFSKIPFFGPLNEYLRKFKGLGPIGDNNEPANNIQSIIAPKQVVPAPPASFSLANLVNHSPLDIVKSQFDILNVDSSSYVRKIKKSNYDELVSKLSGTDQLFSDPDFLPNQQSLGKLDEKTLKSLSWKRLKDIIPNAIFVNDKIDPADILQGSLGDCYFLSALAALAEQDYRVKSIFPKLEVNPNGFYMARLLHNGVLQEVVIDDYFPVTKAGKVGFAQPSGGNEIWVMVLQKCWAKIYGSYANIIGGLPDEVLHAFSSAPVFYRSIGTVKEKQDALWIEILDNFRKGSLLCCGTKGNDPSIEDLGFVKGHAYTILGVYDQPRKMIKVRNPWGHKEWKGRASDYDEEFWSAVSPANKQALDYQDIKRKTNTDGIFFILWQDFISYFQLVQICKINDNAHYNFIETNLKHLTSSLFEIEISKSNQSKNGLTFAITQDNSRGKGQDVEKRGYSRSFLALGKLDQQTGKYRYIASNSAKTFPDNYLELEDSQPGKYILYVKYLWNNGNEQNKVTLSTYSVAPVVLKESTADSNQFLSEIFYDHASKNPKKKVLSNPNDWICSDMLLNSGAFGYVVVNLDSKSNSKLSVQLKQTQYTQKKIELHDPFKGRGQILEEVNSGKPLIVLLSVPAETFPSTLTLPQPQIRPLS